LTATGTSLSDTVMLIRGRLAWIMHWDRFKRTGTNAEQADKQFIS